MRVQYSLGCAQKGFSALNSGENIMFSIVNASSVRPAVRAGLAESCCDLEAQGVAASHKLGKEARNGQNSTPAWECGQEAALQFPNRCPRTPASAGPRSRQSCLRAAPAPLFSRQLAQARFCSRFGRLTGRIDHQRFGRRRSQFEGRRGEPRAMQTSRPDVRAGANAA